MENTAYYEKFKIVPEEAKKEIKGGRLKGLTDINPMWRILTLTEAFGPCGIGWNVKLVNERTVSGGKDEVAIFIDVELTYKVDGEWSYPVFGTGGSLLVANETGGLRLDDEAYKKAYTDAISVACKALGIGADVYWGKDSTKYSGAPEKPQAATEKTSEFQNAEIRKMEKLILKLGADAGRDESKVRMFAEEWIERSTGNFVPWGEMNIGHLASVKVEMAKRIDGK